MRVEAESNWTAHHHPNLGRGSHSDLSSSASTKPGRAARHCYGGGWEHEAAEGSKGGSMTQQQLWHETKGEG